jgi:Fe-S cluster assembly protein SufD
MNAPVPGLQGGGFGTGGFLARFEGVRNRLPGDPAVREAAAAAFAATGLPTPRTEAWKYTSLRHLAEMTFAAPGSSADPPALDAPGPRLVFFQGAFHPDLSDAPGFACAGAVPTDAGHNDALRALNAMLSEDGAELRLPAGRAGGTLTLLSVGRDHAGTPVAFHPRHRIVLEAGARLTLLDIACGDGAYLHNPAYDIVVGAGATLTHVRLQQEGAAATHLSSVQAEIAAGGTYDSFALNLGGALQRMEVHATLAGRGATAHLNAAQLLRKRQHGDFTTTVTHAAPNCASRQTVKTVLDQRAKGVFQGRIHVHRAAQKTDGYQMNQALLLSPTAEMNSKPQLEIYADDVKCSHGATVGELDADQMFYLRARGIPAEEARAILVRAFLTEALEAVPEGVRPLLDAAVDAWWIPA